ncbi:MAG: PadR family transcriptional regulator [Anaerolineaceae bacterium]|nr:PadR family transcriptional regulator [Anaerolineaceae bacterium]
MKRDKRLPLTETSFYILLALKNPMHGYLAMQEVENLSEGEVRIAPGTMYGALENLSSQGLIDSIDGDDPRRKLYRLTSQGQVLLELELTRLKKLTRIAASHGVRGLS